MLAGGAWGHSHVPSYGTRAHAVRIESFRFSPETLTVGAGDSVTWANEDPFLHTVSADSGASWGSGWLSKGNRHVWVPSRPGQFPYHCEAHRVMRGILIVK